MNKLIAITGGIGSGKTSVSKIIKSLGYKVFSADETYSELLNDKSFVKTIYDALDIKSTNYVFDRKLVANKVFNDNDCLKKLNDITHPLIMKKMLENSKNESGVIFNEVPLLFESGYQNLYDEIIVVKRSLEDRVNSVTKRDGISKNDVLARINNQYDYENKLNIEHTLIVNDGSLDKLTSSVKVVLEKIVK